jgi:DNA-binding beta-propeller fold protein YncE
VSLPAAQQFDPPTMRTGPGRLRLASLLSLAFLALALAVGARPAAAIVPLGQFGEGPGDAAGLLAGPVGVGVDPIGRVYVAENAAASARVSVFAPNGAFLRAFGKDVVPGNRDTGFEQCTTICQRGERAGDAGELDQPLGVAVDADGVVYVAEAGNDRISVFNQQGGFVRAFGKDVDSSGDGTGYEICTNNCKPGVEGSGPGELKSPAGIAIDPQGVLWVADSANSRVSLYTREGAFLRAFGKGVNRILGGRTDRCSSRCGPGVRSGEAGALNLPGAAAVDAAGNVYVSEGLNNRVSIFAPDLSFLRAFGTDVIPGNGQTGFEVCTSGSGCKAGSIGAVFGRPGSGVRKNGAGVLNRPVGLAVDGNGNLHVAELENHRVSVFTPVPAFVEAFGKDVVLDNALTGFEECQAACKEGVSGAGPGELSFPGLLAPDCRGALYVADFDNGRVQRFGEPGTDPPPCGQPAALSKPFGIMRVRRNARKGTATLIVSVPWSAGLRLHGPGIRTVTKQVEFAGRTWLSLRPDRATRRRLARFGQARVRARVTYTPWGGDRRTKTRAITLRTRAQAAAQAR